MATEGRTARYRPGAYFGRNLSLTTIIGHFLANAAESPPAGDVTV